MNRLSGKRILITGASSGIGAACARRLGEAGANLSLWARRRSRLDALATELSSGHGIEVRVAEVDVRNREVVATEATALLHDGWVPDVLLNNAGLAAGMATVQEGDLEDWDRMIDTNVKGLLFVTRAVLPAMIERDAGHVVNIGSTAGHQVYPKGNVYNASKFAVSCTRSSQRSAFMETMNERSPYTADSNP
jgi:3-hydroxy acid dehydrogenase/malonic semialdehyde reductase